MKLEGSLKLEPAGPFELLRRVTARDIKGKEEDAGAITAARARLLRSELGRAVDIAPLVAGVRLLRPSLMPVVKTVLEMNRALGVAGGHLGEWVDIPSGLVLGVGDNSDS